MRGRFTALLATLVAFLLSAPLVSEQERPGPALVGLFAVVLLVGVYAVSRGRRAALAASALAAAALLLRLGHLATGETWAAMGAWGAASLFLAFTAYVVLRRVMAPGDVDGDRIAGAVCVYLLLGLGWAFLYAVVETARPGSFGLPSGAEGETAFTYYSFTTLTTLGYGDVTPHTQLARTLAWLEAVTGQMFLAVTVATLVGLRIGRAAGASDRERRGPREPRTP